jgi:hypothetical protein
MPRHLLFSREELDLFLREGDLSRDRSQAKASHSKNHMQTNSETSFPPLGSRQNHF